jgi:hypothetical protein
MTRLNEEKIAENMEIVKRMVSQWPEPRRRLVSKMLIGQVGEEFFTAPASVREEYHNCFPGGLCDHSLRVVENLKSVEAALCSNERTRRPHHLLEFVGLFHDLGKVGDGSHPYYLPNPDEWQRAKRGVIYITNRECAYMPTSERGLFVLQKHGIELSVDEYLAIRLNDGQYDDTNKNYRMKEPDLALLVHFADRWATQQEKGSFQT